MLFFRPTHNICHNELPLLTYFDEETPTDSKLHNLSRIYYSFDLIKVVVNTSESSMNVYLCSLKSSLGLKQKISAVLELLVQKNQILFVKPPKNSISYLVTYI